MCPNYTQGKVKEMLLVDRNILYTTKLLVLIHKFTQTTLLKPGCWDNILKGVYLHA